MTRLTELFAAVAEDQPGAADQILQLVYDELREIARQKLSRETPGQTLQPTALVHEAWLRMGGREQTDWRSRSYFFAACGEAMRRILVDHARARGRDKRGGQHQRVELDSKLSGITPDDVDLVALDEAMNKLGEEFPRKARLVELRFFAGMTIDEAAVALSISRATAERDWTFAKAFLHHEVHR